MITSHSPKDLISLLRSRADVTPQQTLYTFLGNDAKVSQDLTYQELDLRAQRIAARLQALVPAGERVVLLFPPGLDFISAFFGCLYAGAVAVPVIPPNFRRTNRNLHRLLNIAATCHPRLILSTREIRQNATPTLRELRQLSDIAWSSLEEMSDVVQWNDRAVASSALACLQYTSGSTSNPKGVMLSHECLLANLAHLHRFCGHGQNHRSAIWLPPYHDMGLIGGILLPLFGGFPVTLMSPLTFLRRPVLWLETISKTKATITGSPNFGYDLCVRSVTPEQKSTLDLSRWRVAFNGAEPVSWDTLNQFAKAFEPCGFHFDTFHPCYGLAEASLIVAGQQKPFRNEATIFSKSGLQMGIVRPEIDVADRHTLTSCGNPLEKVVIADPQTLTQARPNYVGEIWVAGPSVAQGYWANPEETKRTFEVQLEPNGSERFLRTGDLGFLYHGELFVTGRIKDLMIVNGQNYYPQDLEATVSGSHPALHGHSNAVFSIEMDGKERIIVLQELATKQQSENDVSSLLDVIRTSLVREHDVDPHVVAVVASGVLPKTPSGKMQRYVCREFFVNNGFSFVATRCYETEAGPLHILPLDMEVLLSLPESERLARLESQLASWIARKFRVPLEMVAREVNLFDLGFLDSLRVVELIHELQTKFEIDLSITGVFAENSIAGLAKAVLRSVETGVRLPRLIPAPTSEEAFPLSYGQRALWFVHQMPLGKVAYNLGVSARIEGNLSSSALAAALQKLTDRHSSLRTRFIWADNQPLQVSQSSCVVDFAEVARGDVSLCDIRAELNAEVGRPFALDRAPLFRTRLFRSKTHGAFLLMVGHHIILDLWSLIIILDELTFLLKVGDQLCLPPVQFSYRDFVNWQSTLLDSSQGETLRRYWMNKLSPEVPLLDLPTDFPRSQLQEFRGSSQTFLLRKEALESARALAKSEGTTLYTILLATFKALLFRLTQQQDICVGSPALGRSRAEFKGIAGYCVNPVALRSHLERHVSLRGLIRSVKATVQEAFEHQDYPFPLLMERLQGPHRAARSSPLQAFFSFQKSQSRMDWMPLLLAQPGANVELGGASLKSFPVEQTTSQFEMLVMVTEGNDGLFGSWQYNSSLYTAETIARLIRHWETILVSVSNHSHQPIGVLPLLKKDETRVILKDWNDTKRCFGNPATVSELFHVRASEIPDAIAACFGDSQISYADLDRRSNALAHYLRSLGIGPEVLVGICVERSLELIVGLLGILKVGGAYVPLDSSYPPERLAYMIDDARLGFIVTHGHALPDGVGANTKRVHIDAFRENCPQSIALPPQLDVSLDQAMYMIYTSGSTGTPKGALNTHRSIYNRLAWMQETFPLTMDDVVLQKTPYTFDVSVWELFWPLIAGARLVFAEPASHKDAHYLIRTIQSSQITTIHFVPSMLENLLSVPGLERCTVLRRVICSGEVLPVDLQNRFLARTSVPLHNLYGPTETAIDVTWWACTVGERTSVPIGRPISNVKIYILDQDLQPVPVGVAGEIYVGGVALGRGYHKRPAMTAERFVPNPHAETPGERLYKTGDLARYLPDGNVDFLGRLDFQVKIRGFRIELEEIERTLLQYESVGQAVVVPLEEHGQSKSLVAYFVKSSPEAVISSSDLRRYLTTKLPEYMIPTHFVALESIPLSSSGKINRTALPAPDRSPVSSQRYVPPQTEMQLQLAEIWAEALGKSPIGIEDNFFELGGHSLLMTRIVARIRETFGVDLPVTQFFKGPTISELAVSIQQCKLEKYSSDEISALLDRLEHLSDADVENLLLAQKS